jgi:hypothetical protein
MTLGNERFDNETISEFEVGFEKYAKCVTRLITELEMHQRFWFYLAYFELGGGFPSC